MKWMVALIAGLMFVSVAFAEDGEACAAGQDQAKSGEHKQRGDPAERFKAMDKNGNGAIDKDEFKGPPEAFAKIDNDGNGSISPEEMKAAHAKRRQGRGNPEEWFKKCDKNGNGAIDKDEFKGPADGFAKMDADGNGSISLDEIKAAFAKHGKGRHGDGKKDGGKDDDDDKGEEATEDKAL